MPDPITAIVGSSIGGGVISSISAKNSADTAADAQVQAAAMQAAESRRQFDKMQEVLSPYVQAGEGSLSEQMNLLGMGGEEGQRAAIQRIEQSPQFSALVGQGEEAILQNASATGGLRGGNVQGALAQFRPQMLSQLIEQQYGRLGGITQMGQASAVGVGAGAIQTGQDIGQAYMQSGQAQAGAALAAGQAQQQAIGDISGTIGTLGTLKLLGKF